jgi:hypothetical protein
MIMQGLLWFDDNPSRTTEEIIERAAARYRQKYNERPTHCYVHPATPGLEHAKKAAEAMDIQLESAHSVLPHHFWLGIVEPVKAEPVA